MARWRLLVVLPFATVLVGCKGKPCGPDAQVDTRPLPPAWAANWDTPPGSTMCMFEAGEYGDVQRHVNVAADSTPAAVAAWERALTAKGWSKLPPTKEDLEAAIRNDCMRGDNYQHPDGSKLGVGVSACAEGSPGWSTVGFTPAKKP